MTARLARWTLDVHDLPLMATFWSRALDYRVEEEHDGTVQLLPSAARLTEPPRAVEPGPPALLPRN